MITRHPAPSRLVPLLALILISSALAPSASQGAGGRFATHTVTATQLKGNLLGDSIRQDSLVYLPAGYDDGTARAEPRSSWCRPEVTKSLSYVRVCQERPADAGLSILGVREVWQSTSDFFPPSRRAEAASCQIPIPSRGRRPQPGAAEHRYILQFIVDNENFTGGRSNRDAVLRYAARRA